MTWPARWTLTPRAFERLLERLGPDRESAGREYQSLRTRLLDYFDWKGAQQPELAADETLDRVARRLEEGEPIERLEGYTYGVARLVLLEQARLHLRERKASAQAALEPAAGPPPNEEARIACLMRCLERLPAEERALIVAYYEGAGRSHLEGRKALAARLGLVYATLKTRTHRLRLRLEACMRACLAEEDPRR